MTFYLSSGFLALAVLVGTPGSAAAQVGRAQDGTYGCITCHTDKRRSFTMGVHPERGIRCDDCHGGDPSSFEVRDAHIGSFIGHPDKPGILRLCATCHADPNQMRQYGLPADQLAELEASRHGQLLRRGNDDAPTCTDCHDAHLVLRPEDARSNVYPTNVATTCATCHDDATLMGSYGLPADQFEQYRSGAHGVALYEEQNFASPTCTGCHGSHAALPPGVAEIDNVCGRCHALIRRAFDDGPHGAAVAAGMLPGCLGCHSNHETERIPLDLTAQTCLGCHDENSNAASVGERLQAGMLRAQGELHSAEIAIEELIEMGEQVSEMQFRYRTALTEFRQIPQVLHSFDLDRLEDLGLRVRSGSQLVQDTADDRAEERWEHKLLLAPLWFFALAVVALALLKRREAAREDAP